MTSVCVRCLTVALLLNVFSVSSRQLHAKPDGEELGAQVGSDLRAADEQVAAEASQNIEGKSDFQHAYVETLTSNEMVLMNPEVSKVIKQTNGLASSLVGDKDSLCERRWNAPCPDGWTISGDDQCVAPFSYGGACKKVQSFSGKSLAEKQQFSDECQSPWPCQDDCAEGRDYTSLCPQGWSEIGGGFCVAPENFKTNCATSYNFAEMDTKTKEELGQTCAFEWNCNVGCTQDLSQACPEDWNEVPMNPGMCVAPATYSGICSFSINTASMSFDQKHAFAQKCLAKFKCLGKASVVGAAAEPSNEAYALPDGPVGVDGRILTAVRMPVRAINKQTFATENETLEMFRVPSGPLAMRFLQDPALA